MSAKFVSGNKMLEASVSPIFRYYIVIASIIHIGQSTVFRDQYILSPLTPTPFDQKGISFRTAWFYDKNTYLINSFQLNVPLHNRNASERGEVYRI